ncbi:hypothetical protein [Longitalea arenae]|uniref:hypothetical protein n=1 Tax=Longitalea arenae TaxID=2812558 RepID=UPI0019678ECD|nr:hypothetical protein [Longitalea arenae]
MDHKLEQLRQTAPVIENRVGLALTVERLQQQVNAIGLERDVRSALESNIQKDTDRFNLSLETESGGDKLGIKLHFINQGSSFDFPGYDVTLLHHTPIAHRQINGVDTRELDHRMKNADWYYSIAESQEKLINGFKNSEAIELDLRLLSRNEQGTILAAQLWNNHVPLNTIAKPDFIAAIEAAHDLYPKSSFPADIKISQAHEILKAQYQEQQLNRERPSIRPEYAFCENEKKNHMTSKAETPAKETKHKHRRRLQ